MGLGLFYARAINVNVKGNRVKRALFIAGMLLFVLPFSGKAQTQPTFSNGSSQALNICENETISLNPYLTVSDIDFGQTETWSVSIPPSHGTLNGFGSSPSENSGSTNIALTTAVSYTPNSNYTGTESFQIKVNDDHGDGVSFINISISVNGSPIAVLKSFPSVCTGVTTTALFFDTIQHVSDVSDTFRYFGIPQPWVKPTGVNSVTFAAYGAEGGRNTIDIGSPAPNTIPAGKGGYVGGVLNVSSYPLLIVNVGGPGDSSESIIPGFNGGGGAYTDPSLGRGGTGGGASDIRGGGVALSNRLVVAAGGGGNGWDAVNGTCVGGDGGGINGIAGCTNLFGSFAKGGTALFGGAGALNPPFPAGGNGVAGQGGDASHRYLTTPTDSVADGIGGGGGGGFFGGGGGAASGGGGGSSYTNPGLTSGVTNSTGVNGGGTTIAPGLVVITYLTVGTYTIDYDAVANGVGFVDVPTTYPLPAKADGFPVIIPVGTPAAIYNATLTISNGICNTSYPFTVEVKQTPDVNPVPNITVCNGLATPVTFGTTVGTTPVYTWSNSNTAIGAANSGTGSFSFVATNTTTAPATGTFTVTPTEFGCTGASTMFTITTNPQPSLTIGGPAQVCSGVTTAVIPFSNLVNVGTFTNTYSYLSGNTLPQVFTVPANVTSVTFDVMGGIGGSDDQSLAPAPGKGGRIKGALTVSAGNPLNIYVGGRGFNGSPFGAAGGYNGGGDAIYWPGIGCGGAGGGASDIRLGGIALTDRVVVAGGGGGSGYDAPLGYAGGDGGGIIGANSSVNIDGSYAGGGTQSAGGIGATYTSQIPGGNGGLGFGGNGSPQGVSGAGGGGYYGGGGGVWTGGGGGSSYSDPSITNSIVHSQGDNLGDGSVTITYVTQGTYTLTWTGAAAGVFADVTTPTLLPDSAISVAIPGTADAGTYTATLTLDNGLCQKTFPIIVTVNPLPDVILTPNGNQVMCNGVASIAVAFSNSTADPDVKYIWTNDNPSIGLAAMDSVDIPSFPAVNSGTTSQVANIVVTPVQTITGCVGIPALFSYSVNPTPHLTNTTASACSATPVNFIASSATSGTTFNWSRPTWPSISNLPNSGTGDITESLTNVTDSVSITVPYEYDLSANSCTDTETVWVTVKPKPVLQGQYTHFLCKGDMFPNALVETSLVSGTAYSWDVLFTLGSTVPAGHYPGPGAVTDIMGNLTPNPITVQYKFHTEADGCFDDKDVYITVKPLPELTSGSAHTDAHTSIQCSGTTFLYSATSGTLGFSYIWNRISVAGITVAPPNLGTTAINDVLVNNTNGSLTVPYEFHLMADGCSSPADSVFVTVDPIPVMNSVKDTFVCSGVTFLYTPTANTPALGTTFAWDRRAVPGLSFPGALSSSGPINTAYIDTTTHAVTVEYDFRITYGTCQNFDTVHITVNPTPKYTASLDTVFRCHLSNFPNYAPASSTSGATFAWSRPYTPGITNPAATGTGDLNSELLKNSTYFSIPVEYTFTVSANGCTGDVVKLPVVIHPNPTLSSDLTPHYTCNGVAFYYPAASYVSGATFKWDRFVVKGVYGDSVNSTTKHFYSTNFGTGDVYEALFDTDYVTHRVLYLYRVTANGCTNLTKDSVYVNVVPGPRLPQILTNSPLAPCSNTQYQTFTASEAPVSGVVSYDWYANNATVWSSTKDHQSIYVNFNFAGPSYVRLTGTTFSNGCKTADSLFVNVTTGVSETMKLVYYQGQFVCLRSDMDTYQWGYDDMATFTSVTIPGATEQNVYVPGADLQRYRYWVITTHNGCMQKAYYNSPLGINEVSTADITDMKLYPNPTKDNINVLINTTLDGNMQVELLNLLGQKLSTVIAADHKATIDVSNLPGGCYLVDCYHDGVKIATSRFIKN